MFMYKAAYRFCIGCLLGLTVSQQASGIVLSYYRFEKDYDAGIGLEARDEKDLENLGGFALIADAATVDDSASPGSLPPLFVPDPEFGSSNTASLDGLEPNINAKAAHNSKLDVPELTVELFARTEESTAVMAARSTSDLTNASVPIADGFRIYDPQALKVDFWTYDGVLGSQVMHTISTSYGMDFDGTVNGVAEWRHVAFSYEYGIGRLYLDQEVIGSTTVNAGDELYWGDGSSSGAEVFVGIEMDGYDFSKTDNDNGYVDELRFSDEALAPKFLLQPVPEPNAYALILGLISGAAVCARRRR
ncbi:MULTISPECIES: LamG domain-containing protein [unclassified Lentimonas]|uniref:LamG domain-containing protein n=1 Tax=unclassified Lentimonas TaxID=2630993 RepID=UPI0013284181|nr:MULTISPECIES: LamG domain-containing protein [unclassified Lentimonas]CAA6678300.1 Unannotated [Lentimonas sp. CC4]CAA6684805.1 Unannotated [Lentimonas sp. CC6]CAA7076841.1 Unannotated [Lentimonas sp. CC4]CAA7170761.1 Unannotated [Lentimonas sp. CC21]CAA7179677.1 Unannotated [Lentimonas sp. CC8]